MPANFELTDDLEPQAVGRYEATVFPSGTGITLNYASGEAGQPPVMIDFSPGELLALAKIAEENRAVLEANLPYEDRVQQERAVTIDTGGPEPFPLNESISGGQS